MTALFFPGLMSYDPLFQYQQVIGKIPVNNDHPPVMVYLWQAIHRLIPSPGSLLLVHQLAYWGAAALFACAAASGFAWRLVLFLLIGLWPPLFIHSVHLWKDTGMMIAMMFGTACLFADARKPHLAFLALAALFLFYAGAVRHNAVTGILPLWIAFAWRVATRFQIERRAVRYAVIVFSGLVLTGLAFAINRGIDTETERPSIVVWIGSFDLSAVSLSRSENMFPGTIASTQRPDFLDDLRKVFLPETNNYLYKVIHVTKEQEADLTKAWFSMIRNHPVDYLRHRTHLVRALLGVHRGRLFYPFHHGIDRNELGITFTSLDKFVPRWQSVFEFANRSFLYRPWLYFLLATAYFVGTGILMLRNKLNDNFSFVLALSSSGLLTVLPLFVLSPAADYRYVIWMIASTLLATIFLLRELVATMHRRHADANAQLRPAG